MKKFFTLFRLEAVALMLFLVVSVYSAFMTNSDAYLQEQRRLDKLHTKIVSINANKPLLTSPLATRRMSTENSITSRICPIYINLDKLEQSPLTTQLIGISNHINSFGSSKLKLTGLVIEKKLLPYYSHVSTTAVNYDAAPFEFPMPLGQLDSNSSNNSDHDNKKMSIHSKSQENGQSKHSQLSNLQSPAGHHAIFNATFLPTTTILKIQDNSSKNLVSGTNSPAILSNASLNARRATNMTTNSSNIYNLQINGKTFPIKYQIEGTSNKLTAITLEKDNTTLLANISSKSKGKLSIEIPGNLIDSENNQRTASTSYNDYAVFEDGQYTAYNETINNNKRELAIDFDNGTGQIEIAGNHKVPEFTGSAIVGLFTLSTTAIIIIIIIARIRYNSFIVSLQQL